MKEIIIKKYEAFDGETFDTRKECADYEKKMKQPKGVVLLNKDHLPITDINYAYFAYLPNEKAREWFKELHDVESICCDFDFDETTHYVKYNDTTNIWEDVEFLISELEEIRTTLDLTDKEESEEEEDEM